MHCIWLLILWTLSLSTLIARSNCSSHSAFVPRSITHDATYELALSNYDFYHSRCPNKIINLYLTPFYQQSFNGKHVAPYFLLNGKCCVDFEQDGSGDVDPMWFDLISGNNQNYSSTICAVPKRSVYGMHIALFADLSCYCKNMWGAVEFAPIGTKQEVQLCETNIQSSEDTLISGIENGIDALTNPALHYGRFNQCSMKKAGVDDIQFKLGWNHFSCDQDEHIGGYLVLTVPTGSVPNNVFVFQPRVGSHNAALGLGLNGDCVVYEFEDTHTVHFMADVKFRYLFGAHECRSFDGCQNGPWSRYLQVVTEDQASNPFIGINSCFTRNATITPRSQLEVWTAFHWMYCNTHIEIGWNLWVRQSEKAKFDCCCCHYGIYDLGADAQRQNARHQQIRQPISASRARINQSVFASNAILSDAVFTPVCNLNTKSAAHPTAFSNKVYAAIAYDSYICSIPTFIGLGASAELGHAPNAFDYWSVWGKWGLEF